MRQVDGTELLGAHDPRGASIGVIYVSPDDDRQSVLAAILTQDKLGRNQVVIVLPEQNRAFQRPVDFDGLKNMRRGLQAQIIFVIPAGSSPAEFARQRRFLVYSSLEQYAQALQGEDSKQEETKRRWLFGRREKSQKVSPVTPAASPTDTLDEPTQPLPGRPVPPSEQIPIGTGIETGDHSIPPNTTDEDEEQEFPLVSPVTREDDLVPVQANVEPRPNAPIDAEDDTDPSIITFHQPRGEARSNVPAPLAPIAPPNIVPAYPVRRTPPAYSRRRNRRPWLIAAALLLLLLVCVYILSRIFLGPTPSATVAITPDSKYLKNTYTIYAVTGNPDATRHQVQARLLFSSTSPHSKTVNATGTGSIPASQAVGILTFYNSATFMQSVAIDTVFVGTDGVEVVNDERADIPAANLPQEGSITVTAHAVKPGAGGNISALDINGKCCLSGITVQNVTAFSGGLDKQNYSYVQQSDIDSAASDLETSLIQNAQASVQKQMHANEQLAGPPQCLSTVTSDHSASDKVANVTVNVTVTCIGETYDHQGVVSMAGGLLKEDAANSPGAGYSLVGNVVTAVTQVTVDKNETVSLLVNAEGIWVYQFNDAQKKTLAKLIAGKNQKDAQTLLQKQLGVGKANIQLSGGDVDTLPTDLSQITIVVLNVSGVQGTPAAPTSTPTPVTTETSPSTTPIATPTLTHGPGGG